MRILVVTRELALLRSLWSSAKLNPWHVETSEQAWEVLERIQQPDGIQLLVLDTAYAERDSLHLLRWLGRAPRGFHIIVVCHSEDTNTKNEAMRLGASQVLTRPLRENELEAGIRSALDSFRQRTEVGMPCAELEDDFFLSVSPVMQKVRAQAELLAQAEVPALIVGEPGSGTAAVAHLIHRLSANSGHPFHNISCAAMTRQLIEAGPLARRASFDDGPDSGQAQLDFRQPGTILFEDISEMPPAAQARLSEVLQDTQGSGSPTGNPKMRILATGGPDIEEVVAEKRLREDLYSRLSAFTIHIPPLRRRKDEIEVLLRYSMFKLANQFKLRPRDFTRETLDACLSYSWPGNIRELESFVKRYLLAETQEPSPQREDILTYPDSAAAKEQVAAALHAEQTASSLKSMIQDLTCKAERNAIAAALQKTHWNRKAAARLLRVSYRTLLYKIERYQMYDSAASLGPNTNLPH